LWFKNTPTKLEKYAREKEIGHFLRSFFEKFPLFSKNHGIFSSKTRKKVCFTPENWKIEKRRGILTFAKSSFFPDL